MRTRCFKQTRNTAPEPVDPILEGLSLLLDLESNPERELSRYEKRLLRKTYGAAFS